MSRDAIVISGLGFSYRDGARVLDGISLSVEEGSSVCIAGPNGAGKSTLLLCLAGLLKFEGTLFMAGRELGNSDRHGRSPSLFGLVFQDADDQLFCTSVYDDVAFGPINTGLPRDEVGMRVRESLAVVALDGFELRVPHHLSGGEKKRAAIASVLACLPAILALDEPWAGLDARASRAVAAILTGFPGTRLVVTQDPLRHAARVCDRLVILDSGKVVADGPMERLSGDVSLLERHGLAWSDPPAGTPAVIDCNPLQPYHRRQAAVRTGETDP